MNALCIFLATLAWPGGSYSAEPAPEAAEDKFNKSLEILKQLQEAKLLRREIEIAGKNPNAEFTAERISKAKEAKTNAYGLFQKLFKLIELGKTIFEYPGLISFADAISYLPKSSLRKGQKPTGYAFVLGIPESGAEEGYSWARYTIHVDERGVILELRPAVMRTL